MSVPRPLHRPDLKARDATAPVHEGQRRARDHATDRATDRATDTAIPI